MRRLTLITGGASSGKSRHACAQAARHGERVLYVATCEPQDDGMRAKIERHRAERPSFWTTVERSHKLADLLGTASCDAGIVDCITLLVSQLMIEGAGERDILQEIDALAAAPFAFPLYVVTNEVGQGVIPANALARRFAELQGRANQRLAEQADAVVWMVCGIPVHVKGSACPA
jgi:adenosylcobinamide kinase/adenosylcobinamide-phosphate guanylyltransferase